ncbi:hypothetical protein [Psychroserpens sp. SPM9]|uniref:hypothetical protein n=1 Tax=Psychroserpens sp. SPM9 TaxID=2975598 RepID=UPI0021A2AC86|nr:hypothetical protein [Psychroserpens sp. SPM9]MDG5491395.1 hypothetical protein [Psychroserpens sp. SPM9]
MIKRVVIVALFLGCGMGFAQDLKCKKFKTGTFIIPGDSIVPQSTLKRSKAVQVESISAKESMTLDIEWIDDCNYVLKLSKSTPEEDISEIEKMIDAEGGLRIQMLRTVKDTMYFRAKATIKGVEYPVNGYQIKVSKDF